MFFNNHLLIGIRMNFWVFLFFVFLDCSAELFSLLRIVIIYKKIGKPWQGVRNYEARET